MPLINDKCSNCHTFLLGRQKSLFYDSSYGIIWSGAEYCKTETKQETVDKGKMIYDKKMERTVARCPVCGRTDKSDWLDIEVEKEWKDDGCKKQ